MDEEIRLGLAEANAKAFAALCLQTALITSLKLKGILSDEDMLSMTGTANEVLHSLSGVSSEQRELSESVLRGLASTWTKRVSKN
jgi:hypothetical protein